jgi:GxxExxY protein
MNTDEERLNFITERIIGCAFKFHNTLKCGFAERVYENACALELRRLGMKVETQVPIEVLYDGVPVGNYVADMIVEDMVIVENKAVMQPDEDAILAQCLNYLVCTRKQICLLLNYGKRVEVKRFRPPRSAE